jgi:hypothetical protein
MRGTFICAQIEIYEYTNRISSVDVEHFSVDVEPYPLSYTYYCILPPLAAAVYIWREQKTRPGQTVPEKVVDSR